MLKEASDIFDTLVFLKRAFFDTRVSVFKTRVFAHLSSCENLRLPNALVSSGLTLVLFNSVSGRDTHPVQWCAPFAVYPCY